MNWGVFTGDKKKKRVLDATFPTRKAAKNEILKLKGDLGIKIPLYPKRRRRK